MFTRRLSSIAIAAVLLAMAVVRIDIPPKMTRLGFSLVVEWGVIAVCAVYVMATMNRWAGAFVLACLYSMIWPVYTELSFFAMYAVLVGVAWLLIISQTKPSSVHLLNAMCLIVIANVCFAVAQAASFNIHYPTVGLMANSNEASCLYGICLPAFFRPKWVFLSIAPIVGLVLSRSFGGVVAAGVAVSVFGWMSGYKWVFIVCILTGVLFAILVDTPGVDFRVIIAEKIFGWIKERPFGTGLGHFKAMVIAREFTYLGTRPVTAHNEFLQLLFEAPAAFVVLIGYLAVTLKRVSGRPIIAAGIAAIVASSCVHFTFHIATTAIIGVTWLAMVEYGNSTESSALVGDLRDSSFRGRLA